MFESKGSLGFFHENIMNSSVWTMSILKIDGALFGSYPTDSGIPLAFFCPCVGWVDEQCHLDL